MPPSGDCHKFDDAVDHLIGGDACGMRLVGQDKAVAENVMDDRLYVVRA